MGEQGKRLETRLIHVGEPRIEGAVSMPIFQSSTYVHIGSGGYHDVRYMRLNNTPNHLVLAEKLADAEGAEAGLVAASGMAAISTSLLAFLTAGDHLLVQERLYGGTHDFVHKDLKALGVEVTPIDVERPETWEKALRPKTRALYVETIGNPLLEVGDLDALASFASRHKLVSLIDNTFASPVNFRPAEHGFDLSLHSATKYLNGHSDIVAGVITGRRNLVEAVKHKLDHFGGSLDTHACFLLQRGLKTLVLRMKHHNESTLLLAQFLERHPRVARVHYPLLETSSSYARARKLLTGGGGVLSFELKGSVADADRLLERVQLPIRAPSLGGTETLITRPALTSHVGIDPAERRRIGIPDTLVRMAVGLEATDDLIDDLHQALAA